MNQNNNKYPIIDLHCDMLHYLATSKNPNPENIDDIGCAIPRLKEGNVKLQVMAISCVEDPPQTEFSLIQSQWYQRLVMDYSLHFENIKNSGDIESVLKSDKTGIITAIENAAALCGNDESLDKGFERLETISKFLGKPLYISLSHHGETRFGGGNQTKVGLKDDGRSLLDYINGRKIAIDFSHTSDKLAHELIDYIDSHNLNIPVIASHSNYREVYDHPRNLPDNLAREIINRQGLIGVNFLRAFTHLTDPNVLTDHIMHGLDLGGEKAICFGADYFYTASHPDKSRIPFYFEEHEHASKYQNIIQGLKNNLTTQQLENLAYNNVVQFMAKYW